MVIDKCYPHEIKFSLTLVFNKAIYVVDVIYSAESRITLVAEIGEISKRSFQVPNFHLYNGRSLVEGGNKLFSLRNLMLPWCLQVHHVHELLSFSNKLFHFSLHMF